MAHQLRFVVTLWLLVACGGKSLNHAGSESGSGGSAGESGSGHAAGRTGSTSSGGTTPSAGAAAGGGAQGGAPADVCSRFGDDSGTVILVDLVNETAVPLYLGSEDVTCGTVPIFHVTDPGGTQLSTIADCRTPCDVALEEGPRGCGNLCRSPTALALPPGTGYTTAWSGLAFVPVTMPAECVTSPAGSTECLQAQRIQPGELTFSARAAEEIACALSVGCGACQLDDAGGCVTQGAVLAGKLRSASTTVLLDSSFDIFPHKAAPNPDGSGSEPDREVPRVRIVFTD